MVKAMKTVRLACCMTLGLLALAACDVKAAPSGDAAAQASSIYADEPKGDQGVSSRCAKIANPAERRKCILTSG